MKSLIPSRKHLTTASETHRLVQVVQKPWPKDKPLVSIILPCFNRGTFLNSAVESIFLQSFQDFEIIIVESGSTDGITSGIVKKIKHPKIKTFIRHRQYSAGNNHNFGIKKARGKYVCCLDADDTLEIMFLERALFLLECAGYDIVSSNYRFVGSENKEIALPAHPSFPQIAAGASSPNTAVFEKRFWAKTGGYHDNGSKSQPIAEDWDFYIRAAGLGARIYNLQDPLLNLNWPAERLSRNPQNPSYAIQLQTLRKRHKKILQHKTFENFVRRNETVFSIASSTRNLVGRAGTSQTSGTLIISPSSLNTLDLNRHLKQISNIDSQGNVVILTFDSTSNLPAHLYDRYTSLTPSIYSLVDTADNSTLKITLLDYIIETRQIRTFIVGSVVFKREDMSQLLNLYDQIASHKSPLPLLPTMVG